MFNKDGLDSVKNTLHVFFYLGAPHNFDNECQRTIITGHVNYVQDVAEYVQWFC